MSDESDLMCPLCHVGKLREVKTTFTQVIDDQVIVMPNVTALVCDICGERTMDPDTLVHLSGLLGMGRPNLTDPVPWFPWKSR